MTIDEIADHLILTRSVPVADLDTVVRRRLRQGELLRLQRGALIPADFWRSLHPHDRYRGRCIAAALATPGRPVLARASAVAVWGLPLLTSPSRVHVLSSSASGSRPSGPLHRHATSSLDDGVIERDGIRMTSPARSLAEMAIDSEHRDLVVALDNALHSGIVSPDGVEEWIGRLGIVRGARRLRAGLAVADARSESVGETWSRLLISQLGFEPPVLQRLLNTRVGSVRVDFAWPRAGVVGEFDGMIKYTDRELLGTRSPADVVIQEKRREDAVRALGERVCRWTWADLEHPRRLERILIDGGVPRRRDG